MEKIRINIASSQTLIHNFRLYNHLNDCIVTVWVWALEFQFHNSIPADALKLRIKVPNVSIVCYRNELKKVLGNSKFLCGLGGSKARADAPTHTPLLAVGLCPDEKRQSWPDRCKRANEKKTFIENFTILETKNFSLASAPIFRVLFWEIFRSCRRTFLMVYKMSII